MLPPRQAAVTLSELCVRAGCACPAFIRQNAPAGLTAIYDDEIERAAQEAFQRDYVTFGFARWL